MFGLDFIEGHGFGTIGIILVELTGVYYIFSFLNSFFGSTVVQSSAKPRSTRRCLFLSSFFVGFFEFGLNVSLFELFCVNIVVSISV